MLGSFETARLSFRPLSLEDVDLLVVLDSDPEVVRFLAARPSSHDEVATTIQMHLGCRWVAFDRATGVFVGWFGLAPRQDDVYELGYRLARQWWGKGLATEGTRALIDAAFSTWSAQRITAQTMAVNQRSRRVMERCGMRHVQTFQLEFEDPLPGTEQGEVEYELTLDAWRRCGT